MGIRKMLRYGTIAEQRFGKAVRDRFDIAYIRSRTRWMTKKETFIED